MWSPELGHWQAALSERRVALAYARPWGRPRPAGEGFRPCLPYEDKPAWCAAVDTLTGWLAQQPARRRPVQVVLSGRFVRWQLLPWNDALGRPVELQAFAQARMREAFGPVADQWSVRYAMGRPGRALCVAAVDAALIDALRAACDAAGAALQAVAPYFSTAFAHWQRRIDRRGAWFAVHESDHLSLGLVQGGDWLSLSGCRVDAQWRVAMNRLMAQSAILAGVDAAALPVYLVSDDGASQQPGEVAQHRLMPAGDRVATQWRMATGA